MPHKLTKEQKEEIIHKYTTTNISGCELGRQYGVYGESINSFLRRKGIKTRNDPSTFNRKYKFNENYFEKIDTEDKAYFLGLLYADGCNYPNRNSVEISLQEKDKYILEKFNECLKSNRPINIRERNKENKNWQNQYRLTITHKKISTDLLKLGCIQNKSLILKFPTENQVPKYLLNHFVRGMIDGDGCISICKARRYNGLTFRVRLVSTIYFCNALKSELRNILDINCIISAHNNPNNKITKELSVGGNRQVTKLLDWLYKNATIFLTRKHDKYIQLQEYNKIKGKS